MPPVIALLPVIATIGAAYFGATALVTAIVVAVATIASMVLMKITAKKPSGNKINQGADLQTKINPNLPRTVCIGQTGIGPSCHFAYTYTDDSDKPNRYLMRVLQISDQPINGLLAVYDGKNTLTFAGDVTTGWFACNQHLNASGGACMWMRVYKGVFSGAVADATLISNSGGQWTSAHKGTGLAYAIVKYDYDADAFPSGEPDLVFSVQGAKMYDDRADSTVAGGSGSQRIATPSTWTYTDNTAIAIAQYLRGFKIGNTRILGVGAESRDLLPAMLFSAYNTCDQNVSYSGGTEKRYVTGINLGSDQTAENHLSDLSLAMDGKIFDRGGSITIWPGAVRTPVMNVQPQDIDWTAEKSYQPKASLDQLVNCVQGNFIDKDNFYQERDLPVRTNPTWEANDGGERFSQFLSLKGVNRWSQGQRIMHRTHQASRFNAIAAFVGGIWLMEMEQGDWFTMTSPRWNMVSKYFEVNEITLTRDMRVAVVAEEVSTTLDDWAHAVDEFARNDTFWNGPNYDLPVPTFSLTDYWYYDDVTGQQAFGINFNLLTPVSRAGSFIERIEIQWAPLSNLTDTHNAGFVTLDTRTKLILGLLPDTEYAFRARCTDGVRYGPWSAWPGMAGQPGNRRSNAGSSVLRSAIGRLDKYASDGILAPAEKRRLQASFGGLETEYTQATTRAAALGITFTALTAARTAWQTQLNSLNPLWNDFSQETDLYIPLIPEDNFATLWAGSATKTVVGRYAQLADTHAGAQDLWSVGVACAANTQYSTGVVVKKDTTGKATRSAVLQLNCAGGGVQKLAMVAFDTKTGEWSKNASADEADVLDLGEAWFVYLVATTNTGNTSIAPTIFPAFGTNLSLSGSIATTGSILAQDPVLALGNSTKLGAAILIGRETEYVNLLKDLWRQLGDRDNAWNIAGSGFTIGDVRNLPAIAGVGTRFRYSGAVSYTATTTTATLSTTAGTATAGSVSIAYNAMNRNVTGSPGTTVSYFLYVDDSSYAGGTPTGGLKTTTDPLVLAQDDGRVWLGAVDVTYPSSGTGGGAGGAGGGGCIVEEELVHTKRGWIPVEEAEPGDEVRIVKDFITNTLGWAVIKGLESHEEISYELVGRDSGDRVLCSMMTPITCQDGSVVDVHAIGDKRIPFVDGDTIRWEQVDLHHAGKRRVRRLHTGGNTFVAGSREGKGIATHNYIK